MNTEELMDLIERARAEEGPVRPPTDLLRRAQSATARRRRLRGGLVGLGLAALVAAGSIGVYLVDRPDRPARPDPSSYADQDGPKSPAGAPAIWMVDPTQALDSSSTAFVALVTPLDCMGADLPVVNEPSIEYTSSRITVTVTVAPPSESGSILCIGRQPVPLRVELSEPLGGRELFDGACSPGRPTAREAPCEFVDPVRWSASSRGE